VINVISYRDICPVLKKARLIPSVFIQSSAVHCLYVAFFQPVTTPALPNTYEDSAAAGDYDAFVQNLDTYLQETTQSLNDLDPADYVPDLSQLDALIESLRIGQR
jgi:hypothetical protein